VADLKTRKVSTLEFAGMDKLVARMPRSEAAAETIRLEPQTVTPGDGKLTLSVKLPEGYELNPNAPSQLVLSVDGGSVQLDGAAAKPILKPQFPLTILLKVTEGEARIKAALVLYYCKAGKEGLCLFKEATIVAPVKGAPGAKTSEVELPYTVRVSP